MRGTTWRASGLLVGALYLLACGGGETTRGGSTTTETDPVGNRRGPRPTGPVPQALQPLVEAIEAADDAHPETIATIGRLLRELEDGERAAFRREIPARGTVEMRLSPNGSHLVTTDGRHTAVWDVARGEPTRAAPDAGTPPESDPARAAFADDGSVCADVAAGDARVLEVESGREIGVVHRLAAAIDEVAVARGGTRIAVVATRSGRSEATIWEVASGRRIGRPIPVQTGEQTWAPFADARRVRFAGDGGLLLTLAPSGADVEIWNAQTGRRAGSLFAQAPDPSAQVAPRGDAHVWISGERPRIVTLADGTELRALPEQSSAVSPDGARVVARTVEGRNQIHPLDATGAAQPVQLAQAGDRSGAGPGRFFDRGRKVWALVGPDTVGIFDAGDGHLLAELAGREAFGAPNHPHLWVGGGGFATIWREGETPIRLWSGRESIVQVEWRPDGAPVTRSDVLTVWDPAHAPREGAPSIEIAGVGRMEWSTDGRRLFAMLGDAARLRGLDRSYRALEPERASPVVIDRATLRRVGDPREVVVRVPHPQPALLGDAAAVVFRDERTGDEVDRMAGSSLRGELRFDASAQRAIVIRGGWHAHLRGGGARGDAGRLSLIDARTGRELAALAEEAIGASAISADGRRVAAVVGPALVSWGGRDGRQQAAPALDPSAPGGDVHLSSDGSRVVIAGWDGAGLYDPRTGRELAHLWTAEPPEDVPGLEPLGGLRSKDVAFTPNGAQLVSSANGSGIWDAARAVRLAEVPGVIAAARTDGTTPWIVAWHDRGLSRWDVRTARRTWAVAGLLDITTMRFAAETGAVLLGGDDGSVRVLDGARGTETGRWAMGREIGDGALSADAAWAATTVERFSTDGEVHRAQGGALAGTIHVSTGVIAMAFAPDGSEIAVAGPDGVRFFPIGADRVAANACRAVSARAPEARLPSRCHGPPSRAQRKP